MPVAKTFPKRASPGFLGVVKRRGKGKICVKTEHMKQWKMLVPLCTDILRQETMTAWDPKAFTWGCAGWRPPPRSKCVQDLQREFKGSSLGSFSRLEWRWGGLFASETRRKYPPLPSLSHIPIRILLRNPILLSPLG